MAITSRGFSGRRTPSDVTLPPGQYPTTDFPVLSAGPTPRVPLDQWEFTINEGTDVLRRWDWKAFRKLPAETITVDIHCVTRWSKLGTHWEGVSLDTMFVDIKTDASHTLVHSYGATPQIFLWKISWTSRRGSRFDLTTMILLPNTAARLDFLSLIFIYGRAPNG